MWDRLTWNNSAFSICRWKVIYWYRKRCLEKLSLYIRAIERGLSAPIFLKINKKVTNGTVDLKSPLKKSLGKIPLYLLAAEKGYFIAIFSKVNRKVTSDIFWTENILLYTSHWARPKNNLKKKFVQNFSEKIGKPQSYLKWFGVANNWWKSHVLVRRHIGVKRDLLKKFPLLTSQREGLVDNHSTWAVTEL